MQISPPPNKEMKVLDRDRFQRIFRIPALIVPSAKCGPLMEKLRKEQMLLNLPKLKSIVSCDEYKGSTEYKYILLEPSMREKHELNETFKKIVVDNDYERKDYSLVLNYDYWSSEQILRSILPEDLNTPGSFETVGHIAHVNLREKYLPYKKVIGQVILDKNKHIRTVVNKMDSIDHAFRFFNMEILAGEEDFIAELQESGCRFKFDFSKVYWNSRLQGEHERIVKKFFKKNDLVCDVFAGVGPFAIPAAKNKGAIVFANDLNPESFRWLKNNIESNKVEGYIHPNNSDGRDFIRNSLKLINETSVLEELAIKRVKKDKKSKLNPTSVQKSEKFHYFNHYVMNLPATALEFLDSFRGLFSDFSDQIPDSIEMPIIHCHCFSKAVDMENDVIKTASSFLNYELQKEDIVNIHRVRDVAPKKEMLCLSFRLPREVAFET